eukprot:852572-Amorphochlora_amoeboformis.AAC.1
MWMVKDKRERKKIERGEDNKHSKASALGRGLVRRLARRLVRGLVRAVLSRARMQVPRIWV